MDLINDSSNPYKFATVELTSEEKTFSLMLYILGMFTSFFGPLILYAIKKEESKFFEAQAKNYFNFMISYVIYLTVSLILTSVLIGIIPLLFFSIAFYIYSVIGMIKVNQGEDYLAPFSLRFFKN